MQRYMRFYWAKKVLEFTGNFETAYDFLIDQNDKYALDARDPSGYSGVAWTFGVQDRAFRVS